MVEMLRGRALRRQRAARVQLSNQPSAGIYRRELRDTRGPFEYQLKTNKSAVMIFSIKRANARGLDELILVCTIVHLEIHSDPMTR